MAKETTKKKEDKEDERRQERRKTGSLLDVSFVFKPDAKGQEG